MSAPRVPLRNPQSAIKHGSIGVDDRYLGDTNTGDGYGLGRAVGLGGSVALDSSSLLEGLNSGGRDGFALCKELAFSI